MKLLLLTLCLILSASVAAKEPPPHFVPVLIYHKFDPTEPLSDMNIHPSKFDQQLAWLRSSGYTTVTARQLTDILLQRLPMPHKAVAITIDDGWKSTLSAVTLLNKHKMSVTLYLLTNTLTYSAYLNTSDIKSLSNQRNVEIGAHTHTHYMQWVDKMDAAPTQTMVYEMALSKLLLEDITGQQVTSFAWPFGYVRREAEEMIPKLGFTSAMQVNDHTRNAPLAVHPLSIKRLNMDGRCTMSRFKNMVITGQWEKCDEKDVEVAEESLQKK